MSENQCHYCGWFRGHHDPACPETDKVLRLTRIQRWEIGYDHGRSGQPIRSNHPTYGLGWAKGDAAADSARNGQYYD
jgi:hypothetical protein